MKSCLLLFLVQSYRMHLKSSNGPIDVLVCPEDDAQIPSPQPVTPLTPPTLACTASTSHTTASRPSTYSSVLDQSSSQGLIQGLVVPDHHQDHHMHHSPQPHPPSSALTHHTSCTTLEAGRQQQEATPNVNPDPAPHVNPTYSQILVPGGNSDLEISLSSAADVDSDLEGLMDHFDPTNLLPVDMAMFEHLSPPLQNEDFSFSMDNSTEGIHDLFDLH